MASRILEKWTYIPVDPFLRNVVGALTQSQSSSISEVKGVPGSEEPLGIWVKK